jgi:hypothetical protein
VLREIKGDMRYSCNGEECHSSGDWASLKGVTQETRQIWMPQQWYNKKVFV